MATETESIELSSLRITGHRSVPRTTEDVNVNQPEPTVIKTKCNVVEKDDPSSGDSHGSPRFESAPKIKRRGRIQFAALCFSTTGPLLPTIQRHYHVNFAVVSILFVCSCIGFLIGAISNVFFTESFNFGKTIVLGATSQLVAYTIMAPAPPFPVLVIGYVINGFGSALQDAQANGFVAALKDDSAIKMNFLHAAYGVGALTSPIIATQFAQRTHWSYHYLTSLGVCIANVVFLTTVFKLKTQDAILSESGQPPAETSTSQQSTMRQILGAKSVHLLAFFILVYVGIEVTVGGWIVTFIIDERGGGPNSGYISAGFFGGLTVGRMVLHYATRWIPERNTIFLYSALSITFELTIWLVPSLIGNAISVSLIGFLLGPMYPAVMNQAADILPRWLLTGSIGWIAGFGQAGSALLPFMTGALANKFGINSLQPLLVAAIVLMILLWAAVVSRGQRRLD